MAFRDYVIHQLSKIAFILKLSELKEFLTAKEQAVIMNLPVDWDMDFVEVFGKRVKTPAELREVYDFVMRGPRLTVADLKFRGKYKGKLAEVHLKKTGKRRWLEDLPSGSGGGNNIYTVIYDGKRHPFSTLEGFKGFFSEAAQAA